MFTENNTANVAAQDYVERRMRIAPNVDIFETEDAFMLVADMPGVSKDNISVKVEDKNLFITGKRDLDSVKNRKYLMKETYTGHFFRRFRISEGINAAEINAEFSNGQLTLRLPKQQSVRGREIQVQ